MQLSHVAKNKIHDSDIKAKLIAATANTVFTTGDQLLVEFQGPVIRPDVSLPRGPERQKPLKDANVQLQKQVFDLLDSVGIDYKEEEIRSAWINNTTIFEPSSIRADQLAALLESDLVAAVQSARLLNAELGR